MRGILGDIIFDWQLHIEKPLNFLFKNLIRLHEMGLVQLKFHSMYNRLIHSRPAKGEHISQMIIV